MSGGTAAELSKTRTMASKSEGFVSSLSCSEVKRRRIFNLPSSLAPVMKIDFHRELGMSPLEKSSCAKPVGFRIASTSSSNSPLKARAAGGLW